MKLPDLKIIGFKVGKRRPTYNITVKNFEEKGTGIGAYFYHALERSDFLSVRKVEAK